MYFIGIDGGGTKTKFILADEQLNVVDEKDYETSNINQIGFNKLIKLLEEGLFYILDNNNIEKKEIAHCSIALPCYTELKEDDKLIEKAVKTVFEGIKFYLCNDSEAGWAGSFACTSGINVVAGTGSIAFGVNEKNEKARSGGWGHFIGDEGSAYWIGKKLIQEYSKQQDFRKPQTYLFRMLNDKLKIHEEFHLIKILEEDFCFDRDKIASLAEYAYTAAKNNDAVAIKIYEMAANELAQHVEGITSVIKFEDEIKVSYSGGVFKAKDFILVPFEKMLKKINSNITLHEPITNPAMGMIINSYIKYNNSNLPDELLNKIKGDNFYENK